MDLLIVSHTPHYLTQGQLTGWGPTVREIDHLKPVLAIGFALLALIALLWAIFRSSSPPALEREQEVSVPVSSDTVGAAAVPEPGLSPVAPSLPEPRSAEVPEVPAALPPPIQAQSEEKRVSPPRLMGSLRFDTRPWSEVFLGKRKLGITPLVDLRLPAGKHWLKAVNSNRGLSKRVQVVIAAGKTTTLMVDLSP